MANEDDPVTLAGRKGKAHLARLAELGRRVSVRSPGATPALENYLLGVKWTQREKRATQLSTEASVSNQA